MLLFNSHVLSKWCHMILEESCMFYQLLYVCNLAGPVCYSANDELDFYGNVLTHITSS